MKLLLSLLFAFSLNAQTWLPFDSERILPFGGGGGYYRCCYDWWVLNTGQSSTLYTKSGTNFLANASEVGTYSLNLPSCWKWTTNCAPVKLALLDGNSIHSQTCWRIIQLIAPGVTTNHILIQRLYPQDVANAFNAAVAWGANVVCFPGGIINPAQPPNDYGLSNAIWQAQTKNGGVLLSCSVPNANVNLSTNYFDPPSSWAKLWNVMPATCLLMDGTKLVNPGAAIGFRVMGWPARNVVRPDGTYYSGTSYAAAMQAGVCALMMAQIHNTPGEYYQGGVIDGLLVAQGLRDTANLLPQGVAVANPAKAMASWDSNWLTYRINPQTEQ